LAREVLTVLHQAKQSRFARKGAFVMAGSWKIGRIAGIDLYMHFTFVLLLAWIVFQEYAAHGNVAEAVGGLVFIIALFGIVVLHELGHALAARYYGIPTRDITLLPIGGVARLERMPEDPKQELVVAVAGPMVNVVLAAGIYVILVVGQGLASMNQMMQAGGDLLSRLFAVNVMLVVFNMLPAFPMDGGRVLRALLAMRLNYVRATQVAANIGQGMAILFALVGGFGIPDVMHPNVLLMFIALFVWLGAAQEARMVQMRSALSGIPVQDAMITRFHTLRPDDPLSAATKHLIAGFQQEFPVVEGERLVGMLTHNDLAEGLRQHGPDVPVSGFMKQQFATAEPREMLNTALARLHNGTTHMMAVTQDGRLLGLLTAENLAEVLMVQEALADRRRSCAPQSRAPAIADFVRSRRQAMPG
jgi:Zn-dependent protease/predicted transcriptional regulator